MTDLALPAGQKPELPFRDMQVMALIGLAHGISHFFQLVLPSLFPLLKDDFQVSYTQLGAVMTVFYVTSGLLQTPAGFLVDRIGARNVLLGGLGLYCAGILLYGLAPSFWMLFPIALLAGAGNSVFHPADYSILNASVNQTRLGRAYGSHTLGGNLGWALAPPLMAGAALLLGWRGALALAAVIGFATLALLLLGRERLAEDVNSKGRAQSAGGDKASLAPMLSLPVLVCFGYFLLLAIGLVAIQNFLPTTLDALHGTPLSLATIALTSFLLGASAGVMLGGIVADRGIPPGKIVVFGLLSAAALLLLVARFDLPALPMVAAIAAAGFLQGSTTPSRDLIVRAAAPKGASGRVFGFVYSGLDAGSALAPLAVGLLLDHGAPQHVLVLSAATFALTTLTVYGIRRVSAQ
ncbi:MFS transporter [Ferrovibrio sp. MS7]|uniref:MFS transporter n=1 Tax=Ferrovibrio plantarum TaxID=3119164 RepID=UPI003135899E